MTIGENIKRIRKEKGLTQKRLSELSGINEAQIRRYELGGKNANPKIETVERIAKALDVNLADIMESITWADYEQSEEHKENIKIFNAYEGIISILKSIYGDVVLHEHEEFPDSEHSVMIRYYTIGTDKTKFVLHEDDINQLLNYTKASFPFIVETLKDVRPENEIVDELIEKNLKLLQDLANGTIKSIQILDE